ncbi:unnamed protein product [Sympodiomycopsis kandeliae]
MPSSTAPPREDKDKRDTKTDPSSKPRLLTPSRTRYLILGLLFRVALLLYGLYQDSHSSLPYTDIDYSVFLDGTRQLVHGCPLSAAVPPGMEPMQDLFEFQQPPNAPLNGCASGWLSIGSRYILQHEDVLVARSQGAQSAEGARQTLGEDAALSLIEPNVIETILLPCSLTLLKPILKPLAAMGNPFARSTFRYTPLLAVILAPGSWFQNEMMENIWGKLVFVLADVLSALIMWDIITTRSQSQENPSTERKGLASWFTSPTHSVGLLWLLNPFPAQIATRGSSESVLALLVLAFAAAAVRLVGNQADKAEKPQQNGDVQKSEKNKPTSESTSSSVQQSTDAEPNADTPDSGLPALPHEAILTPLFLAVAAHLKIYPAIYGFSVLAALKSRYMDSMIFLFTSLYTFFGLSTVVYLIWGQAYLDNSLLYHITRVDHRHNFSPYFLPLYLNNVISHPSNLLPSSNFSSSITSFLPQVLLILTIAYKISSKDLIMSFFLQTYTFVLFNKVTTSQYFIWYLLFLPILLPGWKFSSPTIGYTTIFIWIASQAIWLYSAYGLEFLGKDWFLFTWCNGLIYLVGNVVVLERCLDAWQRGRNTAS